MVVVELSHVDGEGVHRHGDPAERRRDGGMVRVRVRGRGEGGWAARGIGEGVAHQGRVRWQPHGPLLLAGERPLPVLRALRAVRVLRVRGPLPRPGAGHG